MIGSERILPRIPLIPGVNTDEKTIQQTITFLKDINYNGKVHLMPYNKLTKTKYIKIGMEDKYKDFGDLMNDKIDDIKSLFEKHSYEVIINH